MRISDWSSDVCSSDLLADLARVVRGVAGLGESHVDARRVQPRRVLQAGADVVQVRRQVGQRVDEHRPAGHGQLRGELPRLGAARTKEQTSEHQYRIRTTSAVVSLKKKQ